MADRAGEGSGIVRLTTDAVPPRHRASLIGDVMARELAGGDVRVAPDTAVEADWRLMALGLDTVIGRGRQGGFTAVRGPRELADGDADFSLFIAASGSVPFVQNDRHTLVDSRQAVLVAHGRAVGSVWDDSAFTVLRLPRAALAGRRDLDPAGGLALSMQAPAMRLLRAYLGALSSLAAVDTVLALAARHLAELVRAAVDEQLGADPAASDDAARRTARFAAMREVIARRCHEPDLGMAAVAGAVGLSERAGYLVFEAMQESFADTLYAARLDRARDRLAAGFAGRLLDLALDVGFADLSHFNRRFRARFGMTPGEMRARR